MLDDPIRPLKRQLADEILEIASHTNMHVAARVFRIDVPRMSDLRHGRIARFSVERLIRILATVDRRVDLTIVATGREAIHWYHYVGPPFGEAPNEPDPG